MQCSVVIGYQHFGGLCCLHLQGEVKMEALDLAYGGSTVL